VVVVRVLSATEAPINFGELMRAVVERQEAVIVERGGEAQVVVLSIAEYERLRAAEEHVGGWKAAVQRSREQMRRLLGDRPLPPPEDIIRQMREERSEHQLRLR
jgi:prevent-host-death family protein